MSVVKANVVAVHDLSANVPLAGHLTLPLWFSVVLSVTWTVAATSIPPVLLHQGSVMNVRVRSSHMDCFICNNLVNQDSFNNSVKLVYLTFTLCHSDWTTGPHCEHCRAGSFGSALAGGGGCVPCECNGHGDPLRGYCHNLTGQCYCTHNTQGPHCESCLSGYYGDPR